MVTSVSQTSQQTFGGMFALQDQIMKDLRSLQSVYDLGPGRSRGPWMVLNSSSRLLQARLRGHMTPVCVCVHVCVLDVL